MTICHHVVKVFHNITYSVNCQQQNHKTTWKIQNIPGCQVVQKYQVVQRDPMWKTHINQLGYRDSDRPIDDSSYEFTKRDLMWNGIPLALIEHPVYNIIQKYSFAVFIFNKNKTPWILSTVQSWLSKMHCCNPSGIHT